jgi:tRNA G46 methylase TrmB
MTIHSYLAFDWASLPDDSLIVDVGGGVGSAMLEIAKAFPKLNYVVQDVPGVALEGEKVSCHHFPISPLNAVLT